jgi:FMN phosphatase YigB (HAD superfamily)
MLTSPVADADRATALVFLLDVDNTLLDNDRFSVDLDARLTQALGPAGQQRYRAIYQTLRTQRGYADYLEPLQQMRRDFEADPDLLQLSAFLLDYPFADLLYPRALDAIAYLRSLGTPVILSDGDIVFQPRKIQRSGVWDAVQGRVLVYLHKEHMLDAVQQAYPAHHYVMVDDKPRLLTAIKTVLGPRVTTVFVRQGHYAAQASGDVLQPTPDLVIDHIGDLVGMDRARLCPRPITTQEFP